jgi:hypothetical protein
MKMLCSIKMASHIKNCSVNVKGSNMSKRTLHCSYGSCFKAMVIKHAKLTSEVARKYSISGSRH